MFLGGKEDVGDKDLLDLVRGSKVKAQRLLSILASNIH